MKRIFKFTAISSLILALASCTNPLPANNTPINLNSDIQNNDLNTEYSRFTTKALTQSYLLRKINTWLSQGKGVNLVKELDYARYKYPDLVVSLINTQPSLLTDILAVTEIQQRILFDPAFAMFMQGLAPLQPAATITGETRINSYTHNYQVQPSVARSANGNFVVVWESNEQDGSGLGLYAQIYNGSGAPLGSQFRVNNTTTGDQYTGAVAMDSQGNFVVAWSGQEPAGWFDIYARKFGSDGTPLGDEFKVNTYTTKSQWYPAVAMASQGNFVVTWSSDGQDGSGFGIYAQMYSNSTAPVGTEFIVNESVIGDQQDAAIACDSAGNFIIGWTTHVSNQPGNTQDVHAKRFNSDGSSAGPEFQVNSSTNSSQITPSIAMDSSGDYVIAWSSYGQDGDGWGVFAQRYNSDGSPAGNEFPVNTGYRVSPQDFPSTAIDNNGNFIITWESLGVDISGDWGVVAKRYDNNGNVVQNEFIVNTYSNDGQFSPAVASDGSGNFVIVWGSSGQDGDSVGIYGKRFDNNGNEL